MSDNSSNDIAVIGMAAHLPGAPDVELFWQNLRQGVESVRPFSNEELEAAGVPRSEYTRPEYVKAGILLEDLASFDGTFFGFTPKDAAIMDPQHRHFLECAWEALEHAGHTAEAFDGSIGVYAGCGMGGYFLFNVCTNPELIDQVGLFLLRHTGNDKDFLSTRVSYEMNLRGPSVNVQTACSTSAVAIHMACQSLLGGECDMALAGGVTILMPHGQGYRYEENEVLSPDGHCRAFDHDAQGTVFGSGAGIVVLRRLEDALADGDTIHAVIKGSAINNDGIGKVGYLAPSVDGQGDAIAEAIAVAGVEADTISYVEAHGTGTAVGDPIEISALTQAFRETSERNGFCRIGSVKTNIGHLDTAAGVASVIKVVQALKHRELPPTLNFRRANPAIDFAATPFVVNDELTPWETEGGPRRAGVSSLGVGGTNAHLVLEEAPSLEPSSEPTRATQLYCVSARSRAALDRNAQRLADWLEDGERTPTELADAAWTLRHGRVAFEHRRVVSASSASEAARLLRESRPGRVFDLQAPSQGRGVAFLMPGGGTQYPRMGADLYASEPEYRKAFDECIAACDEELGAALTRAILCEASDLDAARAALESPALQLPALFVTSYATARLVMSLGVEPRALLGHSLGENTAACLAGVFELRDALGLVALRGRLCESTEPGGMVSVALPREAVLELCPDELCLAAVNAPELCAVSGPLAALESFEEALRERGIEFDRIRVATAGHSHLLDPILPEFEALLRSIRLSPPRIPFVSNRTGTWITDAQATDPCYWVEHLRNTVHFSDGIATLLEDPDCALLEAGPGNVLGSLARMTGGARVAKTTINTLRHRDEDVDDQTFLLTTLGRLWGVGAEVDLDRLCAGETRRRIPLPTYSFERQRYWIEPGDGGAFGARPESELRKLEDLEQWFHEPVWTQVELSGAAAQPKTWLVFADDSAFSQRTLSELEARGIQPVVVRPGAGFERVSEHEFRVLPAGRTDYDELLAALAESGRTPERVAHLWLVNESEETDVTTNFFHMVQERGFYSLLFLAQALGDSAFDGSLSICVFTNRMQSVAGEALAHPEKAAVLGPCKVLPREMPGIACKSVDLELPERGLFRGTARKLEALCASVVDEAGRDFEHAVVALRDGKRFVEEVRPRPLAETADAPVKRGSVVLVTGGLGGIGLVMAEHLARHAQAKLVLVGRRELPRRADWHGWLASHGPRDATSRRIREVERLEELGAEVLTASADVANHDQMRALVEDVVVRFGRIDGVLHAAGVIEDSVIGMKEPASVDRVFTPKIHGTLNLERVLEPFDLDFFVLFSSTSSLLGLVGQVDYTAANAFLNAFAHSRAARGRRTIAIDWGIWQEVGMAAGSLQRPEESSAATPELELVGEPVSHPLLGRRVVDTNDETVFLARYDARELWVLDDHRLATGEALIPGTGYLELARAAHAASGAGDACSIHSINFLAPFGVPDGEPRAARVRVLRGADETRFEIASRAEGSDSWTVHCEGGLRAGADAPAPVALDEWRARCTGDGVALTDDGRVATQARYLAFGPRWQVLRSLRLGDGEALAELALPEEFAGDLDEFRLHPGLLDLCTGFALPLVAGYDGARDFYAPLSYGTVTVHRALERELVSHARLAGPVVGDVATFDVTITNRAGEVLCEVERFCVRRVADSSVLAARAEAPGPEAGERNGALEDGPLQTLLREGILPAEGAEALGRVLAHRPGPQIVVSSMGLEELSDYVDRSHSSAEEGSGATFERPQLDTEFVGPRDEVEDVLVEFWQELLGVDRVGIHDDFFELGGYSLIAVRLFAKVKKRFKLEFPLSVLFEAPTVERLADLVRDELGIAFGESGEEAQSPERTRWTHLVPMHVRRSGEAQSDRPPFFLCAGMFGNVMNLRHLAGHIGQDQPFYGLQARGVDGRSEPHETFEEQAAAYLAEVREVQPSGPYFLGGFSGGGIVAYEMARQLEEAGEEVACLVFLDTWIPQEKYLTHADRREMHRQRFERQGLRYAWGIVWNRLMRNRKRLSQVFNKVMGRIRPFEFSETNIELAFRTALRRYETPERAGSLILFRPALDVAHRLSSGSLVNSRANYVYHDNGWSEFVHGPIEVREVPGDHDNMVLEPHVRVMAAELRRCIDRAERESRAGRILRGPESGGAEADERVA